MSTETVRLIRDGGKGVWRWGEREIIYLSLHCHHQNDCCINSFVTVYLLTITTLES